MSDSVPPDAIAAAADRLNRILVPAARQRVEEMGSDAAGAYNFYAVRLERGDLFADYERALASRLLGSADGYVLHEIGAGYGTFSLLMTALGFDAVCVEMDSRRFEGAVALWNALREQWPDIPGELALVQDRFPSEQLRPNGALAVITNLVATTAASARAAIIAALARYDAAIIDVDRFLEPARELEERQAVLEEFAQSGLAAEPYLDVGRSACFYRITRARE